MYTANIIGQFLACLRSRWLLLYTNDWMISNHKMS